MNIYLVCFDLTETIDFPKQLQIYRMFGIAILEPANFENPNFTNFRVKFMDEINMIVIIKELMIYTELMINLIFYYKLKK